MAVLFLSFLFATIVAFMMMIHLIHARPFDTDHHLISDVATTTKQIDRRQKTQSANDKDVKFCEVNGDAGSGGSGGSAKKGLQVINLSYSAIGPVGCSWGDCIKIRHDEGNVLKAISFKATAVCEFFEDQACQQSVVEPVPFVVPALPFIDFRDPLAVSAGVAGSFRCDDAVKNTLGKAKGATSSLSNAAPGGQTLGDTLSSVGDTTRAS